MKIYSGMKENLEILKVMHKNFTAKFGDICDICELRDVITFDSEEYFNKFKNHFGFTGKVEKGYYFSTENKYLDIYFTGDTDESFKVFVKGSRISGKEVYVLKLDKIFKSNGAESIIKDGYRANILIKSYEIDKIFKMLEGKFKGVVNKNEFTVPVIDLDCGLRVKINAVFSSKHSTFITNITYETL